VPLCGCISVQTTAPKATSPRSIKPNPPPCPPPNRISANAFTDAINIIVSLRAPVSTNAGRIGYDTETTGKLPLNQFRRGSAYARRWSGLRVNRQMPTPMDSTPNP
jgi:hypothetical protein